MTRVFRVTAAVVVTALSAVVAVFPVCAQEIRPLPGALNSIKVLNSNSPEVVQSAGILVSTLAPTGRGDAAAHLNQCFDGAFDIFMHHIAKADDSNATTLYIAVVLHNPEDKLVTVDVLQGASYVSQPDAPFIPLPPSEDNGDGSVYAGPGDRVMNDVLRGSLQSGVTFGKHFEIAPHGDVLLSSLPIPVHGLTPPLNGRSYLVKLQTTGPVQAATLATFAGRSADGAELPPTKADWIALLKDGRLAGPREKAATPLSDTNSPIIYGRVAGVAVGTEWKCAPENLLVPERGGSIAFPIASVARGTFGTGQVQSAPIIAREPDTAFAAHGNYGIKYDITLPLENQSKLDSMVLVKLQTPKKSDLKLVEFASTALPARVFFRGTVRSTFTDAKGIKHVKYTHLTERLGEKMVPLVAQYLGPKEKRTVRIEFFYPPDATPPQVLTVESVAPDSLLD